LPYVSPGGSVQSTVFTHVSLPHIPPHLVRQHRVQPSSSSSSSSRGASNSNETKDKLQSDSGEQLDSVQILSRIACGSYDDLKAKPAKINWSKLMFQHDMSPHADPEMYEDDPM